MSKNPETKPPIDSTMSILFTTKFINLLKAALARNVVIFLAIFQLDNILPKDFSRPPFLHKVLVTLPIILTKAVRNFLIGERIAFCKAFFAIMFYQKL